MLVSHACVFIVQPYAYLTCPKQNLRLERDRIAQHVIGFEVSDEGTGQVLAYGVIRFEDLYQIVKDAIQDHAMSGRLEGIRGGIKRSAAGFSSLSLIATAVGCLWLCCFSHCTKPLVYLPGARPDAPCAARHSRFRVGLEHVDGRGPWGRLECNLDIENLRSYIR